MKSKFDKALEVERLAKLVKIKTLNEITRDRYLTETPELDKAIDILNQYLTKEEDDNEFFKKNQDKSSSKEW